MFLVLACGAEVEAVLEGVDDRSDDGSYRESKLYQGRIEGTKAVAVVSESSGAMTHFAPKVWGTLDWKRNRRPQAGYELYYPGQYLE